MKIGIHTYAWGSHFGNDTLYIIDKCKELGFDFIELPLMEIDAFDPAAVKDRLDGAIEPTCSTIIPNPDWDIGSDDPEKRKRGIAFLKRCIDATAAVGATMFSGNSYVMAKKELPNGPIPQKEWDYCAAAVREAARYAQDFGITIGIEAANRFANHLVNTAEQALHFIDLVGEPNLIVHLDTFHMCYEERSFYDAIIKAGSKLKYFHMCGNDRGKPGEDDIIDWDAVFRALKRVGFDDYLGFEGFDMTCRATRRDLIGKPEDFARDSMAFALQMMEKYGMKRG